MNTQPNDNLVGLIFSRDRAMQLHAVLESFHARCRDSGRIRLYVLYRTSDTFHQRQYELLKDTFANVNFIRETDFRRQTLDIIRSGHYILFMVDDNIFVGDFELLRIVDALARHPEAIGFSLRLGRNTTRNYSRNINVAPPEFNPVAGGILKYDWTRQGYHFGYPLEVSSSVYRTADILPLAEQLEFDNPNTLEGFMAANAALYATRRKFLLCPSLSVAFCNPLNMVQTVCVNRTGGGADGSAENLAKMYERGFRIDIGHYNGLITGACHQDAGLRFRTAGPAEDTPTPLVSVEMVTYNHERFIPAAIDSVLAQSYDNLELIIIDDGSTDGTAGIIQSRPDPRIRYIRKRHENRWAGTNRAIAAARGRFILAVDSDDCIAGDYIERMVAFALKHPEVDFFYPARLLLTDENGTPTGEQWQYGDFSDNTALPHYLFDQAHSPIPYPGSLRRMTLFEKTGPYEELTNVGDFVFLCRNALKITFRRVDDCGAYFYRRIASSLSHRSGARDKITADVLNEMALTYPARIICPGIAAVTDEQARQRLYCRYLAATFRKHADGYHMVKHGEYFQRYADHYEAKLTQLHRESLAGGMKKSTEQCHG